MGYGYDVKMDFCVQIVPNSTLDSSPACDKLFKIEMCLPDRMNVPTMHRSPESAIVSTGRFRRSYRLLPCFLRAAGKNKPAAFKNHQPCHPYEGRYSCH